MTLRAGIPVTTPARALTDLRQRASGEELGHARRQGEIRGYRLGGLEQDASGLPRSELERRFLRLCRIHCLPTPAVNTSMAGYVVDFLWRDRGLIAETDGYRYHHGRAAFEHDYRRQARLVALGFDVLRFTWRLVADDSGEVVAALRARLAAPGR